MSRTTPSRRTSAWAADSPTPTDFPLSIEGSAPAVFEAKANEYLFNRPQSYAVAQAKESARGAGFAAGEKSDEIAYRVASLYIDADRAGRLADSARSRSKAFEKVLETAQARVEEGRDLPITAQEANVNLLRGRQRLVTLESDRDYAAHNLAATLGWNADDVVTPVAEDRAAPAIPATEEAAVQTALSASKELKRLESNYTAKGLEIKGRQIAAPAEGRSRRPVRPAHQVQQLSEYFATFTAQQRRDRRFH